ncbi:MAG: triose-phosphate isomerase [Legionellales bacterium]|nr:triose-phosphate isomerase [Legionellales bacterium]
MRRPLVVANWKMNGNKLCSEQFIADLLSAQDQFTEVDCVIAPPAVYLSSLAPKLVASNIQLSAQNVSEFNQGAYTGEISATMLKECGCHYAIIGHSERRQLYHESNDLIAAKFARLIEAGVIPILCVGETLAERQDNMTYDIILGQIDSIIKLVGAETFLRGIIAYEPVWAIGTGKTASPKQAQEVHATIRSHIVKQLPTQAQAYRIIYGGSVKSENAQELFAMPDIDGGLIGGASLKLDSFLAILRQAGK